ncbi:MAG: HAD family phosphatase [Actinobacteria bacterium]|nr:HAD family phosphatase [Actinomycetota bacterium]
MSNDNYEGSMPQGIFFDMDGLLVDTEPYWLQTESELMAEFGVHWQSEDQLFCLGGPMEKVGRYMSDLAGSRQSPEWFASELIDRMAEKFTLISPMPGISELLSEITKIHIPAALVSASPRRLVDAVLASIPNHPFALSISADDVVRGKPHPDPYLKAAELLNVKIEHSIILEDSPTGVTAARASGAWVVAVPHIAPIAPAQRSVVIETLAGASVTSLWNLVRG